MTHPLLSKAWRRRPLGLPGQPDFLIVGAQKAGTTSLYRWLTQHPQVRPARTKELQFFHRPDYESGWRRYRRSFPSDAQRRVRALTGRPPFVTGEATPYYLFHPYVAARVAASYPDAKIVVLLRDPVERAVSHYWHERRLGNESHELVDALSAEDDRLAADIAAIQQHRSPSEAHRSFSYVRRGLYADQIRRWREHFPDSQLLILQFEQLVESPAAVVDECLGFLGVGPMPASRRAEFTARNAFPRPEVTAEAQRWLAERFREPNEELYELTGVDYRGGGG